MSDLFTLLITPRNIIFYTKIMNFKWPSAKENLFMKS